MQSEHVPTHFAEPGRKSGAEMRQDVAALSNNPVIDCLMSVSNGLFAVLNDKRQLVVLNDAFLKLMGVENAEDVLGLRPGEYVHCVHSCEMPGGCGTSEYCSTCGAVLAMLAALETRTPREGTCALTVEKDNQNIDLYFLVRSCPIHIENSVFLLLFLQDITSQQYRACLENSFFHDINNILCGLTMKSELLAAESLPPQEKLRELNAIIQRIVQEVSIQHNMMLSMDPAYQPLYTDVSINSLLSEIELVFHDHPLTRNRTLNVECLPYDVVLTSDSHLTCRIVVNMVTNALEATPQGGSVRLFTESDANTFTLAVWNRDAIPEDAAKRVFQRNFSTKGALGRGFGTYSMKLFGEKILGGKVTFESSEDSGTTFRFAQKYN